MPEEEEEYQQDEFDEVQDGVEVDVVKVEGNKVMG